MPQDLIVICKSVHHGNTRAVAERMARPLGAVVADPDELTGPWAERSQVLGIGSGIYYGRFHRSVRDWIAKLPPNHGAGRKIFVYSTSGLPFLSPLYHWPIKRALRKSGFEVVGEFTCRGHDTFGPLRLFGGLHRRHPNSADLQRAETFATNVAARLQEPEFQRPRVA